MNSDIRINIDLPRHIKYKRLKRLISISPMEYLINFWGYVARFAPAGELAGWSIDEIEDAAAWDGEPGKLFNSMIIAGFLDDTEGGYYPHDWHDHQTWVTGAPERHEKAKAMANARWSKARNRGDASSIHNSDAASNASSIHNSDAPSPSPSPLPSPKDSEIDLRARDEKMTLQDFSRGYQETFGVIMPGGINQEAREICNHYPREKIIEAFAITAENGGNSLKYLKEVLKGKPKPHTSTRGQPKTFEAMKQDNTIKAMQSLHEDIDNGRTGLESIFGTGSNTGNGVRGGSVEGKTVGLLSRSG